MERIIETLASGLGNSIGWMADHGILLVIFGALWVAFGVALLWSQGSLDQAWATIRGLPLVVQLVVWLLFLPVMAGLWIWETTWPLVIRVLAIVGLAGWNLLVFLPKAAQTATP
jgi:hypothetical protein